MRNALNWFEIPVVDLDRAAAFYATVLDRDALPTDEPQPGRRMAFLPSEGEGVGGALVKDAYGTPAATGTTVFLNAGGDLDAIVSRIEPAGGAVLMPVTDIGPWGRIALLRDTEGNKVGLHSPARG